MEWSPTSPRGLIAVNTRVRARYCPHLEYSNSPHLVQSFFTCCALETRERVSISRPADEYVSMPGSKMRLHSIQGIDGHEHSPSNKFGCGIVFSPVRPDRALVSPVRDRNRSHGSLRRISQSHPSLRAFAGHTLA